MFNVDTINNINSPPPLTSLKISKDDLSEKVHIFENNNLSIEESTNKTATSFFSDTFNKNANISYLNISIGNRIEIKFTNLFNKIKSVVFLYLVLNPAINKHISEQLAKIDPKHYHMNYQKFALSSSKLFKTLQEKHSFPSAYSNLFLRSHFENKLINQIERELKKNKLPSISKEEIQKAHHECSLNYLIKETSTFMDLKNQISIIPSNQMPIDLLKEIELNDENKDFLLSTWKRIVEDLPKKGDLDKLESPYLRSSASLRIECAIKLLEVLKFAPKSVDAKLDEEIAKYSDEAYKLALVNFIVHESSVTNRPINTKYSNLVEKQNAYRTIVKKLEVELKKDFNEIENLTEVKVRKLVNKLYCSISKTR